MANLEESSFEGIDEGLLTDFFSNGGTFKELKNLNDDTMESVYSVAFHLYQNGKYDEAVKVFQFLCFYDHYNTKYYLGLGACRMMQKEYENAIEFFSFAAAMDTKDPKPMLYIGDCYLALGTIESAKIAYQTTIEWAKDKKEFKEEKEKAANHLKRLKESHGE